MTDAEGLPRAAHREPATVELAEQGRSTFFYRGLLFALVAAVVPALTFQAITLYKVHQATRAEVLQTVQLRANVVASTTEALLSQSEAILAVLANHPDARAMSPDRCGPLFRGLDTISPVVVNAVLSDMKGRRICSLTVGPGGQEPEYEAKEWFDEAISNADFTLSEPRLGETTSRHVVLLSLHVRGADGERLGLMTLSLDVLRLSEKVGLPHDDARTVITLTSRKGASLARYPASAADTPATVAQSASDAADRSFGLPIDGLLDGEVVVGADGVERVFANARLTRYGARASAGIPYEEVRQAARNAVLSGLAAAAGVALVTVGLAVWLTRKFIAPVRELLEATQRVALGRVSRLDPVLPGEFGVLAHQFNRLLDSNAQARAGLSEATTHLEKTSRAYQALAATNRAIARVHTEPELLQEVCELCVAFDIAEHAWVTLDRQRLLPVASSEATPGFLLALSSAASASSGLDVTPTSTAMHENRLIVVRDVLGDPRTENWKDIAQRFGMRSAVSVPYRRMGKLAGVLTLHAADTDFYDADRISLLQELAADLSFAMDNFLREQARVAAQEKSRRHEEQLEGIIQTATDGIMTVDAQMRVVVFNDAAAAVFGMSAQEALGRPLDAFIPERFRQAHVKHVDRFRRSPVRARPAGTSVQLWGLRADGTEFPFEGAISRLGTGADTLMTLVFRDVSAEHEARAEREATEAERVRTRARANFFARVSHELRTPLNAMLGFTRLAVDSSRARLSQAELEQFQTVMRAGDQLRALINDVLDATRVDAGGMTLELADVELCALLDEVIDLNQLGADQAGIAFQRDYRALGPVVVRSDPVRLRQVFNNLVNNAVKYNRPHGSVSVSLVRSLSTLSVSVTDTGIGLNAEQQEQLFQPFNRLGRESSGIEGTGIGLSLSRDLLELLGGSLEVQSAPGEGSTFTVKLPRLPQALPPEDTRARTQALAGGPAVAGTADSPAAAPQVQYEGTVLCVDDIRLNAVIIQQLLARWPRVRFDVAASGEEGIEMTRALQPDLVLLDMHLPDMPGTEAVRRLKRDPVTAQSPVVMLSASALSEEVTDALRAGALDYWTKPLEFEKFLADVTRFLRVVPEDAAGASDT